MRNKREHTRFDVVEVQGKMVLANKTEIIDISLGGLSLKADRRLDLGREYLIKLGSQGNSIDVRGTVVRSTLSGMETGADGESVLIYAAGIKFKEGQEDKISVFLGSVGIRKKEDLSPMVERRLHVRFQITTPQKDVLLFPANFKVKEMGFGGMLIQSDYPFGEEGITSMRLFLDKENHLDFTGKIFSTRKKEVNNSVHHETEITFSGLTDHDRETLKKFIDYLATNPEAEFFQLTRTEAEIVQIADALRSMGKCIKAFATYPPNHTIYQKFSAELHAKFELFFTAHEALPLKINKNSIVFQGREVYSSQDRNDNAALMLYVDGIREICFHRGLTLEEIVDFINILRRSSQKAAVDDDIVTLLWERDLKHFSYFVPETIEDEDLVLFEDKLLASQQERAAIVTGLKQLNIPPPSEEELKKLREQLGRLSSENLLVDAIDLFLDMLATEEDRTGCKDLSKHIDTAFTMLLERNLLKKATAVLETLNDFAESCNVVECGQALHQVVEGAGSDRSIQSVLNGGYDPEDIEKYLLLLDANAIGPLLDHLGSREDRKTRRLICNALTVIGKQDVSAIARGLKSKQWYVARNTAMIIGAMKDSSGVKYLSELIKHPEARVRREVVKSLELIGSKETKLPLFTALGDADSNIRIAVLKALRRLGGADVFEQIQSIVSKEDFKRRPIEELRELFEALADLNKEKAFPILAQFFSKKGLFRTTEVKELRAAAADGLAVAGTPEAVALLEKETDISDAVLRKARRSAHRSEDGKR